MFPEYCVSPAGDGSITADNATRDGERELPEAHDHCTSANNTVTFLDILKGDFNVCSASPSSYQQLQV